MLKGDPAPNWRIETLTQFLVQTTRTDRRTARGDRLTGGAQRSLDLLACPVDRWHSSRAGRRNGPRALGAHSAVVDAAPPPPRLTRGTAPECRKNAQPPRESAVQLGPGGEIAEAFVWIREGLERNVPYDEFVRSILTATGTPEASPP